MKQNWIKDLIFLILVSSIGLILPWWSIFVLSFGWSYYQLSSPSAIAVDVYLSHLVLIFYFGFPLLKAIHLLPIETQNAGTSFNYILVTMIALVFSGMCWLVASVAKDISLMRRQM